MKKTIFEEICCSLSHPALDNLLNDKPELLKSGCLENVDYWIDAISQATANKLFVWLGDQSEFILFDGAAGLRSMSFYTETGERKSLCNHVIPCTFSLRDADFRDVFVFLENLIYLIVWISFENMNPDYNQEKRGDEGCWERIKKITQNGILTKQEKNICSDIFAVRNKFAHTINSLENIKYRSVPLRNCYTKKGRGLLNTHINHFFDEDVFIISEKLIQAFRKIQHKQIDPQRLAAALY